LQPKCQITLAFNQHHIVQRPGLVFIVADVVVSVPYLLYAILAWIQGGVLDSLLKVVLRLRISVVVLIFCIDFLIDGISFVASSRLRER
jgi:hypothetical protein